MSRADQHDSDPLSLYRHSQDRDYGQHTTFVQQDRRPSVYAGAMARSLALQEHRDFNYGLPAETNTHNPTSTLPHLSSFPVFNHHNHRPSPPQNSASAIFPSTSPTDRDSPFYRQSQASSAAVAAATSIASRSTLWWSELEPWMDEEYVKQVCGLMNWDPASIKVPHPAPDPTTGQQANNPGYCFLTFPSPAHAASVLAQINKGGPLTMPNSSKPFVMNWASSTATASPLTTSFPSTAIPQTPAATQQYPKEYSIFVGDLAPETSNSDLVAVFRNPVLGLRNDREPKFIRPFLSCKSAKIMLDPSTGVSRGYGFVRFTDEADQQRALIEMHGLYCLSRPMRISPATAKFKAPQAIPGFDLQQAPFGAASNSEITDPSSQAVTIALPLPNSTQTKSVSAPIAAAGSSLSLNSNATTGSSIGGSHSINSMSTGTSSSASLSTSAYASTDDMISIPPATHMGHHQFNSFDTSPIKMASVNPFIQEAQLRQVLAQQAEDPSPRYVISAESWKHHAQARAILGNLIGPNGEQLTSTDPYNTTVFVGGLSPLISEDTLRTFFAPFGDIHYVKVPVGKHCGFVQFVRKADAEKAIEKMQGFPIGGSRIRLSWGRSQYKAAQAAAQAAQTAALQSHFNSIALPAPLPHAVNTLTQDQALEILQKFSAQGYYNGGGPSSSYEVSEIENALLTFGAREEKKEEAPAPSASTSNFTSASRPEVTRAQSSFSPFSPDPNNLYMTSGTTRRESPYSRVETLPHPSKAYAPGFLSLQPPELKVNVANNGSSSEKVSPTSARPSSGARYTGSFSGDSEPHTSLNRAPGRTEAPISRPSSGQMSVPAADADPIQDLNGTLASLDLDRSWKSPEISQGRASG
ncbi:putative RNA-binding protein C23E6.01c [Psilocybe cubensis]|uniref:RRM domain-containing protein n=2 Tax=Psilocybe cubensis TaxID=181762 RepID=A0A8H8CKH7_PSICU|nr:putative RNA-binding protein C23E6.01c [Psilocybe cubensis]KAH9482215.1 putative RNA-binding protein C23E6.01c [Psilocybe cubensis]